MKDALKGTQGEKKAAGQLTLSKPKAISGKPDWFDEYYVTGSQKERDRTLFAG
jgi:hypothetical protein